MVPLLLRDSTGFHVRRFFVSLGVDGALNDPSFYFTMQVNMSEVVFKLLRCSPVAEHS